MKKGAHNVRLTRRVFLATAGATAVAVGIGGAGYLLVQPPNVQLGRVINAYLSLLPDGRVQFVCPAQNLGQGAPFALAMVLAEEMGADPQLVEIVAAPRDASRYGNPDFGGRMVTADSKTTRGYWPVLRLAGAQARLSMIATACKTQGWRVADCVADAHAVRHLPSGAAMGFGEIAQSGRLELPTGSASDLKASQDFKWVGASPRNPEQLAIVTGRKRFGADVRLPDVSVAVLARSPHLGGTVVKVDDARARQVPGVQDIVALPDAVAVVAVHTWAALQGRAALAVEWSSPGPFSSDSEAAALAQALDDPARPGIVLRQSGDGGDTPTYTAEFRVPTLTHVLPEPLNATARARLQGLGVEISGSSQSADLDMRFAAQTWKTAPQLVTSIPHPSGGAYGRRALNDAVRDAALVAKQLGRPVQVIRPLVDEMRRGQVRPAALQRIRASLDAQGRLAHWQHDLASNGVLATMLPSSLKGKNKDEDNTATDGAYHPYRTPGERIRWVNVPSVPTPGFLRGVSASYTVWAIETTVERLARAAKQDPLQWRLAHIDDARLAAVLRKVAEMARWAQGTRSLGMAVMSFRESAVASVAEVVDGTVVGLWIAADVGQVVHRAQVLGQIEGGAVWGISMALWERLEFANGAAQVQSLAHYPLPTLQRLPPIHVHLMESPPGAVPCGAGEIGVPTVIPAICNAFEMATGKQFDRLPLAL